MRHWGPPVNGPMIPLPRRPWSASPKYPQNDPIKPGLATHPPPAARAIFSPALSEVSPSEAVRGRPRPVGDHWATDRRPVGDQLATTARPTSVLIATKIALDF